MDTWIAVGAVAIIAALIIFTTRLIKARITPMCDEFAVTFFELSDYILPKDMKNQFLLSATDGKAATALPMTEQPQLIQEILNREIDDYILARIAKMVEIQLKIKQRTDNLNVLSKQYSASLNRCFKLTNLVFSTVNNLAFIQTKDDVDDFNFYILKQDFILSVTLEKLISADCMKKLQNRFS